MTDSTSTGPFWTQDQTAFETVREAVHVVAEYAADLSCVRVRHAAPALA
jgi:hypothetical protein